MLFDKLLTRGLPVSIVHFLSSWYYVVWRSHTLSNSSVSDSFHVSNGVRQGGVLSPILFALIVYWKQVVLVVNPRRACARVTVVVLCVCCIRLFPL